MTALRPRSLPAEAPMVLARPARAGLEAPLRPLCRGLALAAALSLPAFGPLVADRFALPRRPEAARAAAAPLDPPKGGAGVRVALLREGAR